jgi:hypothetical protein
LLLWLTVAPSTLAPAVAAGVVTNCANDTQLRSLLASGGTVTFSCGASPVTITITQTLEITLASTIIDGGNLITLQGTTGVRLIRHRTLVTTPSALTLRNLTISGAGLSGSGTAANGAAILSVNNSLTPPSYPQTLTIENVRFTNNISSQTGSGTGYDFGGGAIFTQGGILTVTGSTFSGNEARRGAGGAIHGLRSNITVSNSTFSTNKATPYSATNGNSGFGGAIYVDGALSSGNGSIEISGSSFTGNTGANSGGVAYVNLYTAQNESLRIDRSTFTGNSISGGAGGLGGALSGGGTNNGAGQATITITNSAFVNNTVAGGTTGASGGAIAFAQTAAITIANSTFSGNQALGKCLTCYNANGGAIYIVNNPVDYQLLNLTIVGNHADWVGGGITASTSGVLRNSIVANNTAANGGNPWNIQQNCGQRLTTGSNNLQWPALHPSDGNDKLCANGTTIVDPKLAPLADNGGQTQTFALLPGSPALNAGLASTCTAAPISNLDQRGLSRPMGSVCDIGAFEWRPHAAIGVYRANTAVFYLRLSNSAGAVERQFVFGVRRDLPIVGDWDGDGIDSVGTFRRHWGQFWLNGAGNTRPPAPTIRIPFGRPGDKPVVGDWDGDGKDGIGVFRPSTGQFFLRNTLTPGPAQLVITFGTATDTPLVGDWDGDGEASPGLYRPATSQFLLTNTLCTACTATAAHTVSFGAVGDLPLAGDWNGDGITGIGVYRAASGQTLLKNNHTTGGNADISFIYGVTGTDAAPLAGMWTLTP